MKPHYRDRIQLGVIIVVLIALWKAVVWFINYFHAAKHSLSILRLVTL
jgi:hypothetical protein